MFIPNVVQNLTFPAARKSTRIKDPKRPNTKSIWSRLRYLILGVLAHSKSQFLNLVKCIFLLITFSLFANPLFSDEQPVISETPLPETCLEASNIETISSSIGCFFYEIDSLYKTNRTWISASVGKEIGVNCSYYSLGNWLTFQNNLQTNFLDSRVHHLSNGSNAFNLGTGIRYGSPCDGFGVNCYYDWRHKHKKSFQQVALGLEYFWRSWEFRLNAAAPLTNSHTYNRELIEFSDGYFFATKTTDFACRLLSLEVNRMFENLFCNVDLLAGIEPYVINNKSSKTNAGGRIKAHFFIGNLFCTAADLFEIRAMASYDPIFHTRVQVSFNVTIPFLSSWNVPETCHCTSSFYLPPSRSGIVAIETKKHFNFNWTD